MSTRLLVHGHVQGVGYRAWLAAEAANRKLAGWVRNRREGQVEALIFAPVAALPDFIAACRQGPALARVETIDITEEPLTEDDAEFSGFTVRPTV